MHRHALLECGVCLGQHPENVSQKISFFFIINCANETETYIFQRSDMKTNLVLTRSEANRKGLMLCVQITNATEEASTTLLLTSPFYRWGKKGQRERLGQVILFFPSFPIRGC